VANAAAAFDTDSDEHDVEWDSSLTREGVLSQLPQGAVSVDSGDVSGGYICEWVWRVLVQAAILGLVIALYLKTCSVQSQLTVVETVTNSTNDVVTESAALVKKRALYPLNVYWCASTSHPLYCANLYFLCEQCPPTNPWQTLACNTLLAYDGVPEQLGAALTVALHDYSAEIAAEAHAASALETAGEGEGEGEGESK